MQKAIIHTATRVVRRLTTDASPVVASDETAIDLAQDISLGGGFWKLDAQNRKVAATPAEVDAAGVDESLETQRRVTRAQAYQTAIDDLINSIDAASLAQLKPKLKAVFQAFKNLR